MKKNKKAEFSLSVIKSHNKDKVIKLLNWCTVDIPSNGDIITHRLVDRMESTEADLQIYTSLL